MTDTATNKYIATSHPSRAPLLKLFKSLRLEDFTYHLLLKRGLGFRVHLVKSLDNTSVDPSPLSRSAKAHNTINATKSGDTTKFGTGVTFGRSLL